MGKEGNRMETQRTPQGFCDNRARDVASSWLLTIPQRFICSVAQPSSDTLSLPVLSNFNKVAQRFRLFFSVCRAHLRASILGVTSSCFFFSFAGPCFYLTFLGWFAYLYLSIGTLFYPTQCSAPAVGDGQTCSRASMLRRDDHGSALE